MAYFHLDENAPLGEMGCGLGCACRRCSAAPPAIRVMLGEPPVAAAPPSAVLDRFNFDSASVLPAHQSAIIALARRIIASQGSSGPIRALKVIGHTDPRGTEAYNVELGRRRAAEVRRHLLTTLDRMQPHLQLGRLMNVSVETRGETQPIPGSPEGSRRVEVFLPTPAPPPPPPPRPALPALRPVTCPPPTCTPVGPFLASSHGFKFDNSFSITIPLPRPFPSIPASFGLCGGMATAALDYFLSCIPIPSTTAIPTSGTMLFNYLLRRQLDSISAPTFGMVEKFLTWTNLPDTRPSGAIRVLVPTAGLVPGLQELTVPEFRATVASLAAGRPVVLGLVYVGPGSVSLWDNHQVLAYGISSVSPTVTNLRIYDPNEPRDDGVVIRCELLAGGARVRCVEVWPGGATKPVRGFFRMPYARVIPPCLP
jgi:hypothetical protein